MLFVTENKDSCDSTAALWFSGHKWQETQRMWQLGGGERSTPPPPPTLQSWVPPIIRFVIWGLFI